MQESSKAILQESSKAIMQVLVCKVKAFKEWRGRGTERVQT
jgi:hypothetical protein